MTFRCPVCDRQIDSSALRMEWSSGGAYHCPLCNELVRISLPYRLHVAAVSVLIASGFLMALRVHGPLFFFLTVLIWVPVSLSLNAAASRIKPPTLKRGRAWSLY